MSVARFAFGPRLKAHRERQGITLQDIAESTKIGISLLSALERNDVSQWPKGIFRRAFLLSYTRAIDIPFEPVWAEFVQLFPEDGVVVPRPIDHTPLRLMLASRPQRLFAPSVDRIVAAAVDAAAIVIVALALAAVTGTSLGAMVAVCSVTYGAMSTVLIGGSPAQRVLARMWGRSRTPLIDHEAVIGRMPEAGVERAGLTLAGGSATQSASRPRIVAVPTPGSLSSAPRERRVGDR